jgi:hypothetical protein
MRSLGRHRENHHFSLLSLTPITLDFNTFSCYSRSYFATIAVVFYIFRRPLNFVGLSMPIESMIVLTGVIAYCSEYCSSSELSSVFIKTTPEGTAIVYINTQFQLLYNTLFLSYMARAWGMPTSFVHNLFSTPCQRLGPTGSLLPPMGHCCWEIVPYGLAS